MDSFEFQQAFDDFAVKLQNQLKSAKVSWPSHYQVDHVCYRCDSYQLYTQLKKKIQQFAILLHETPINGRPISTFKLNKPLYFQDHQIDVVELPAPKDGRPKPTGFEHIEVVGNFSFDDIKNDYSHCQFSERGLNKDFNKELSLQLTDYTIKFHHMSLESVSHLESNLPVYQAIEQSKVLSLFSQFQPLVVGTYPLNLQNNKSDVDILLYAKDFKEVIKTAETHYSQFHQFKILQNLDDKKNHVLISFLFNEIRFELFAQKTPSHQQRAYLHFQIEERCLKLGGKVLRNKIQKLRQENLKTEPAFAQALDLTGNPYTELLKLHSWPEAKLNSFIQKRLEP